VEEEKEVRKYLARGDSEHPSHRNPAFLDSLTMKKVCNKNMIIVGWLFLFLLPGGTGCAPQQREAARSQMPREIEESQQEAEKSTIGSIVEETKEQVQKLLGGTLPIQPEPQLKPGRDVIRSQQEALSTIKTLLP